MYETVQKIYSMLYCYLITNSPVLSGNMRSMIQLGQIGSDYAQIIIDAPFYDAKQWNKNKTVVHTGITDKYGKTAYAQYVNDYGAFGTRNKSMYWVNRACNNISEIIASEIGATVINKLPLWGSKK